MTTYIVTEAESPPLILVGRLQKRFLYEEINSGKRTQH